MAEVSSHKRDCKCHSVQRSIFGAVGKWPSARFDIVARIIDAKDYGHEGHSWTICKGKQIFTFILATQDLPG